MQRSTSGNAFSGVLPLLQQFHSTCTKNREPSPTIVAEVLNSLKDHSFPVTEEITIMNVSAFVRNVLKNITPQHDIALPFLKICHLFFYKQKIVPSLGLVEMLVPFLFAVVHKNKLQDPEIIWAFRCLDSIVSESPHTLTSLNTIMSTLTPLVKPPQQLHVDCLRLVMNILGSLIALHGKRAAKYLPGLFPPVLTVLRQHTQTKTSNVSLLRLVNSTLRTLHLIIREGKTVHKDGLSALIHCVTATLSSYSQATILSPSFSPYLGTQESRPPRKQDTVTPRLMTKAGRSTGSLSASESSGSDSDAKINQVQVKLCVNALSVVQSLAKVDCRIMQGYWHILLPNTTHLPAGVALHILLTHPAEKLRQAAAVCIEALFEGSRHHLSMATFPAEGEKGRSRATSFTALSARVGHTLLAVLSQLERALTTESAHSVLCALLKLTHTLVAVCPCTKLPLRPIEAMLLSVRTLAVSIHTDVRRAAITALSGLVALRPLPTPVLNQIQGTAPTEEEGPHRVGIIGEMMRFVNCRIDMGGGEDSWADVFPVLLSLAQTHPLMLRPQWPELDPSLHSLLCTHPSFRVRHFAATFLLKYSRALKGLLEGEDICDDAGAPVPPQHFPNAEKKNDDGEGEKKTEGKGEEEEGEGGEKPFSLEEYVREWWRDTLMVHVSVCAADAEAPIRAAALTILSHLPASLFPSLTLPERVYVLSHVIEASHDEDAVVAAACRTSGVFVLVPDVCRDQMFLADALEMNISAAKLGANLQVAQHALWALANVVTAFVGLAHSIRLSLLPANKWSAVVQLALENVKLPEKIRVSACRVLSAALAVCPDPPQLCTQPLLSTITNALFDAFDQSAPKTQWNAILALGALLALSPATSHVPRPEIISHFQKALTASNLKVKIYTCKAILGISARETFGPANLFAGLLHSLLQCGEDGAHTVYAEAAVRTACVEKVYSTVLHLTALAHPPDVADLHELLAAALLSPPPSSSDAWLDLIPPAVENITSNSLFPEPLREAVRKLSEHSTATPAQEPQDQEQ